MGFTRGGLAFLVACSREGVDLGRTLTIGRHHVVAGGPRGVQKGMREGGISISLDDAGLLLSQGDWYCEPILERLGAKSVDSLDMSDYEGATILHDLNDPLPKEYRKSFSTVIDSGTLEHIFDFPTAIESCLDAVEIGGHFVAMGSPVTNYSGHGFYQFTPELWYRVLSKQNGFRVRTMLWRAEPPHARWYEVADPASVKHRVERQSPFRVMLYLAAQRISPAEIFSQSPQQCDYISAWEGGGARPMAKLSDMLLHLYRKSPRLAFLGTLKHATGLGGRGDFRHVSLRDVHFA
jgi:hypothetical protein